VTSPRLTALLVASLALPAAGCRTPSLQDLPWPSQLGWLKGLLAERDDVKYYPTARENFAKGMDHYLKEEWGDASKYFDYVRTKFPHSRYATIAELRLADAHFGKEKWLDSIDAYRAFSRLHPTHDAVAYATFQVAKAYYRQIPEEWFFLPSVSERDQSAAQDAVRAFDDFLIRFPEHERAEEATRLRKEARERLAAHEWYVAGYYEGSHKKGAAFRYERIADLYPDVDYAAEGLMNAAGIWEKLKDPARAQLAYQRVARDYPRSKYASRAASRAQRLAAQAEARRVATQDAGPLPGDADGEEGGAPQDAEDAGPVDPDEDGAP
jgi:outer membrane protein assembly factor BamD